jgi:hypothetical protein
MNPRTGAKTPKARPTTGKKPTTSAMIPSTSDAVAVPFDATGTVRSAMPDERSPTGGPGAGLRDSTPAIQWVYRSVRAAST